MSRIRKAVRSAAKLRIHVSGVSGSGKTYSSLLLAKGLADGDMTKVVVIDSENGSADLYSELGDYSVLALNNFSPEEYIKAIGECETEGFKVIIIDSISHEWQFILNAHAQLEGNSFTNWKYFTPRHDRFKNKILSSSAHIITTVRRNTEYMINETGKFKVEKVGTKEQTREGFEYEVTVAFELQQNNFAKISKDRTGLFPIERNIGKLTEDIGKELLEWSKGDDNPELLIQAAMIEINNASTPDAVKQVMNKYISVKDVEAVKNTIADKIQYFKTLVQ